MNELYAGAPLLNVLCAFLGAAVFFSPHFWLLSLSKHEAPREGGLGVFTFKTAMAAFFAVALVSFLNGFWEGAGVLWPELAALCALAGGAFVYHCAGKRQARAFLKNTGGFLVLTVFKVLGFAVVTVLFVAGLMLCFAALNAVLPSSVFQPVREATFLSGALWIGVLYRLHVRAGERHELAFHHTLWPLAVGLLVLMFPMLFQNLVTSEKFQESLNRPPSLQKV
jgi:hypothetical protein